MILILTKRDLIEKNLIKEIDKLELTDFDLSLRDANRSNLIAYFTGEDYLILKDRNLSSNMILNPDYFVELLNYDLRGYE